MFPSRLRPTCATVVGEICEIFPDRATRLRLGKRAGDSFWRHYRRELSAGFALARHSAGLEREADALRKVTARLRTPVNRAAYDLRDAGEDARSRPLCSMSEKVTGWGGHPRLHTCRVLVISS